MSADKRRTAWEKDGFFVMRRLVPTSETQALEAEVIERIRRDPPAAHSGEQGYFSGPDLFIAPEKGVSPAAAYPEDCISKVFNAHTAGAARRVAEREAVVDVVCELLGPDTDCFQSQFILKNPGVIGQPWHQDSFYFKFDQQPQVGVWVALSRATVENGCLWVIPGSHRRGIHSHVPDTRPAANKGYLEIVDQDVSTKIPVTMEPGDVLFFHSFLMHMSTDNVASYRRTAMVYHYARAGTRAQSPEAAERLARVNRWIRVRRSRESHLKTAS